MYLKNKFCVTQIINMKHNTFCRTKQNTWLIKIKKKPLILKIRHFNSRIDYLVFFCSLTFSIKKLPLLNRRKKTQNFYKINLFFILKNHWLSEKLNINKKVKIVTKTSVPSSRCKICLSIKLTAKNTWKIHFKWKQKKNFFFYKRRNKLIEK